MKGYFKNEMSFQNRREGGGERGGGHPPEIFL
jgi:hypothetical protein